MYIFHIWFQSLTTKNYLVPPPPFQIHFSIDFVVFFNSGFIKIKFLYIYLKHLLKFTCLLSKQNLVFDSFQQKKVFALILIPNFLGRASYAKSFATKADSQNVVFLKQKKLNLSITLRIFLLSISFGYVFTKKILQSIEKIFSNISICLYFYRLCFNVVLFIPIISMSL